MNALSEIARGGKGNGGVGDGMEGGLFDAVRGICWRRGTGREREGCEEVLRSEPDKGLEEKQ
jgi:hypothetical protein